MGLFSRRRTAAVESEAIHQCPFCGSGGVTGGSDGTVACSFCGKTFQVYLRSGFPSMPKVVDGQPFQAEGESPMVDKVVPAATESKEPDESDDSPFDGSNEDGEGLERFKVGASRYQFDGKRYDQDQFVRHLANLIENDA